MRRPMFTVVAVAVSGALALVVAPTAGADTCTDTNGAALPLDIGACADVLAQEARWLRAITAGDRETVESILGPTFTHITSEGQLLDRAGEIAEMTPMAVTMTPSEQDVDIAGTLAVVHGVNTVTDGATVVARERFTDVFELRDGVWLAISAQESPHPAH